MIMQNLDNARRLIRQFKGGTYTFGFGVLKQAGPIAAQLGKRAALIHDPFPGSSAFRETIVESIRAAGLELAGCIDGAAPNAPREDLVRITEQLGRLAPDVVISFGGGSTIDAAGRIYVTTNPGVQVIGPDGKYVGLIPTPRGVITTAFGGKDKKTLFILARGAKDASGNEVANAAQVYTIEMIAQGYKSRAK